MNNVFAWTATSGYTSYPAYISVQRDGDQFRFDIRSGEALGSGTAQAFLPPSQAPALGVALLTPSKLTPYNRGYDVLVARMIDILVSAFLWRDYDITISAQCGLEMRKAKPAAWARALNAFLNWLEPGHCELAIACDAERALTALRILHQLEKP